jgi:hypothetical protein
MDMPTIDTLTPEREYTDDEVRALHLNRQPTPFDPFAYNHPAPGPRRALSRKSGYGDRWCAFCQTPLGTARGQSCSVCKVLREDTMERLRGAAPSPAPPDPSAHEHEDTRDLQNLLQSINEMSRVIGVASAMQNRGGGLKKPQTDDMFAACKDVMVRADAIHRRLREQNQ